MGIQFSCTNCASSLNVKDEFAGRQARCPKCQTVLIVPNSSSHAQPNYEATPAAEEPNWQEATNPYAAPVAVEPGKPQQLAGGDNQPTAVGPGRVIEHAFKVWQENLGVLVGATVLVMAIGMAISFAANIAGAIVEEMANEPMAGVIIILVFDNFFGTLVNWFLAIGLTRIALGAARGQRPEFGLLFSGGDVFLSYAGGAILFGLGLLGGFMLLIIPGIIFALFYWPYSLFIVDNQASAFASFGEASKIAKPNIGTAIVLALASIGIALAGFLAFCIGIIFAAPLISCMFASAYLMMKGEIR